MSNLSKKLDFGRDASEFLRSLEQSSGGESIGRSNSGIHITSLSSSDNGRVRVRALIENPSGSEEVEFSLLYELSSRLSLSVGEIEPELMAEIEYCADVTDAYFSACASLSYADGSLAALERKLIAKGFDRDVAADAIAIISERGLIDENEIVGSRIRAFLKKRWGRSRIIAKLREEGFQGSAIKQAQLTLAEVDFISLCAEYIRRKYPVLPDDRAAREKMYAALSRYGYSTSDIREAISLILEDK